MSKELTTEDKVNLIGQCNEVTRAVAMLAAVYLDLNLEKYISLSYDIDGVTYLLDFKPKPVTTPHHFSESVEEALRKVFDAGVRCGQTNSHHPQDPNYGEYEDRAFMEAGASFQSLQGKAGKTLAECKDEVGREHGFPLNIYLANDPDPTIRNIVEMIDEANKRFYASSSTSVTDGWIRVEDIRSKIEDALDDLHEICHDSRDGDIIQSRNSGLTSAWNKIQEILPLPPSPNT